MLTPARLKRLLGRMTSYSLQMMGEYRLQSADGHGMRGTQEFPNGAISELAIELVLLVLHGIVDVSSRNRMFLQCFVADIRYQLYLLLVTVLEIFQGASRREDGT